MINRQQPPTPTLFMEMEEEWLPFVNETVEPKLGLGRQSKTTSKHILTIGIGVGALIMLVAVPLLRLHSMLATTLDLKLGLGLELDASSAHVQQEHNSNTRWTDPCTFYEKGTGPLPVILMALGRTGSSITWSAMSALTGERNIAYETTGQTANISAQFFECLERDQFAFHNWTLQKLCHIQQRRSDVSINAGIAGFQWKPYMNTFHSEYAIEGLKAIGKSVDPKVKVVYLTRNPLDRKVSNLRHDLSKQAKEDLPAHCEAGDVECNKRFSDVANSGVKLPTGKELIHWLNMDSSQDDDIKASLEEAAVDYVHVSYEKLYGSDDADEWMKIFRFLGVGPMEDLTIEDVRASFNLVSTHSKGRNLTISNFIEVETTLKGTKYEHLLFD